MTVSLIVPVYKAEPWIDECMAAIRAQTYRDVELIVIDDKEGTGAAAARNRGLEKATGEYVVFCDADDLLEVDSIEKMVKSIEWDYGIDMVCGSFRKFGNFDQLVTHPSVVFDMPKLAEYVIGNLRNPRSNQMLSGCWAKLYRRDFVEPFPLLTTAEDMAFNFDYLTRCKRVTFLADTVYYNRKRDGSLSTTYDERNRPGLFGFLEGLKYVKRFLEAFYPADEIEDAVDIAKVYHSILYAQRIGPEALKKVFP